MNCPNCHTPLTRENTAVEARISAIDNETVEVDVVCGKCLRNLDGYADLTNFTLREESK